MLLRFIALFVIFSVANARFFANPVIDGEDCPDPGVILHDGVYYAVTTTNNGKYEKNPIHRSTDLQNWELIGYVFNETNFPDWSRPTYEFWAPEIHKIGNKFNVYFTSRPLDYEFLVLGVATADHPAGPYVDKGEPLLVMNYGLWDPTIINHNGTLMLCWDGDSDLRIRNLTSDGLSFKDDNMMTIMQPELPWEGAGCEGPWYMFRNDYHYLFYSGNDFCSDRYVLGVARSRSITGPYVKQGHPILASNDKFKGPGHGSIVQDIDGVSWVFVHHGWKAGAICGSNPRLLFSTSMEWGDDDWPKNMTLTG